MLKEIGFRDAPRYLACLVIGKVLSWSGGVAVLGFVVVLGRQIFFWLRDGVWIPTSAYSLYLEVAHVPYGSLRTVAWKGVERILAWLWDLPGAAVLVLLGGAMELWPILGDGPVRRRGLLTSQ